MVIKPGWQRERRNDSIIHLDRRWKKIGRGQYISIRKAAGLGDRRLPGEACRHERIIPFRNQGPARSNKFSEFQRDAQRYHPMRICWFRTFFRSRSLRFADLAQVVENVSKLKQIEQELLVVGICRKNQNVPR